MRIRILIKNMRTIENSITTNKILNIIDNEINNEKEVLIKNLKNYLKDKIDNYEKVAELIDNFSKLQVNDKKLKEDIKISNQSQKHGFTIENEIREKVFELKKKDNDTNKHDISKENNKFDSNENISIKSTKSNNIDCGDIKRFYNYNFLEKNTMIVVKYNQIDDTKIITNIYEVDYNREMHKKLFGSLTYQELEEYIKNVKKIPRNVSGDDAKVIFDYLVEKRKIEKNNNMKINISPKIDSKQTRVQCSITNFEKLCKEFITYKTSECIIRNKEIFKSFKSNRRERNIK